MTFKLILASMSLMVCQMTHAEMTVHEGSMLAQPEHQEASHASYNAHLERQQKTIQAYALKPLFWVSLDIKRLLSEDVLDIRKLDLATYTYIKSKHGSRKYKNNFLWSLVMKYQDNTAKSYYLIDIMSELNPIEKTDDIIRAFQQAHARDLKLRYLNLLMDSMDANCAVSHPKDALKAKNFLIDHIKTCQDEDVVSEIMVNFPDCFINEDTYSIVMSRLEWFEDHQPKVFERIVIDSNFWYHWLWLAKKDGGFDSSWIDKLNQKSQEYEDAYKMVDLKPDDKRSNSLFSQKIHEAFMFGLKGREEQDSEFRASQTTKKNMSASLAKDAPFVADEIQSTLKLLKEASEKRNQAHRL